MDTGILIFLAIGFIFEVLLVYYRQRIDSIPIFFTFFPFYLFIKGINELFIFFVILVASFVAFILKEFSINFDANHRIKLYNVISKFLFVFFIISFLFLLISLLNTKSLLIFVIFFLAFGYFYTFLGIGFISSFLEKDLIYKFSSYVENIFKEKDFVNEDIREKVLMVIEPYVRTSKDIFPYRFIFAEYFLLSGFIAVFYFYYIFVNSSDIAHNLVIFQIIYFLVLLSFRVVYNFIVYVISENFLKINILQVISEYEVEFLIKNIKELEIGNEKLRNWLSYLGEFYSKLDDTPNYEDLYSRVYSVLSKSLNFSKFIIFIYDGEVANLKPVFIRGFGGNEFYIKGTAIEVACNSMKPVYYFGGTLFSALALFKDDRSFICSPVKVGKKLVGVIYLSSLNTRNFSEEDVRFVEILSDKFAIMYLLYQEYSKSKEMAIKDGLTGLYTHRYFQELLSKEIENAKLYGYPVCLLMIDTDKFKQYNDTFGHPMGDELLRSIAKIISEHVANKGYVCRYGGDEFAVILPNFYKENAINLAEDIRASYKVLKKGHIQVSASIGVACFPLDCSSKDELIKRADELLYIAKKEGRNRVVY